MQNDRSEFKTARIVPVFPLQNTVFFPRTSLPLHIFEPRYRAMVTDAAAGDGLIAVALADGNQFHSIGTIGRIRDLEELEDGRFNLRLEGLERVEMTEIACDSLYRQVQARPRPEAATEETAEAEQSKLDLLAVLGVLKSAAQPRGQAIVLHQELPFEVVVNATCAGLPIEADLRQSLLEEDDLNGRHRLLAKYLEVVIDAVSRLTRDAGGSALLN